jgi:hypothetical protein
VPTTHHNSLADNAIRAIAVITVSGLAGLAARISYQHMLLLAERAGELGIDAHAFPLTVDGLDLIGVLVLLADRRIRRRPGPLPWAVLTIGTLASLTANIAVAPNNIVARAISGWTAIALLAAAKMLTHLFEPNHTSEPATPAVSAVSAATADTSQDTEPLREPDADNEDVTTVRRRNPHDIARRLPTSDKALAKWRAIWDATKHLDTATPDSAAAHGVSLRTLQFIRSAGEAGHLTTSTPPSPSAASFTPADNPTEANHHGILTDALT